MSEGRALFLTSNFPRWTGDSTTPFVLHLAQDLARLGWTVDVLAPHAPGCAVSETLDGVRVARFRYLWPASQETVCYGGGALVNLRKHPANYAKLPLLVAAELGAAVRRLRAGRYDLLHSHWILPQGFVGVPAARAARLPHVTTVHGGDIFGLRGAMLARAKRWALRKADAVTVNSSATEAAALRIAGDVRRLRRIPIGAGFTPPSPKDVEDINEQYRRGDGPLLVFAGRVVEEKGIDDLLEAVCVLAQELPGVTAVIAGEGQDRTAAQARAAALGVEGRVSFTGWVPPEKIPAYMVAADVFVAPSRVAADGWTEGQGLSIIEAMLAGAPVVATRTGGIVDSVTDGETGLLVEQRSPHDLAAAIRKLATDRGFAKAITANAKQRAEQRFTRRASAESFAALYAELRDRKTNRG